MAQASTSRPVMSLGGDHGGGGGGASATVFDFICLFTHDLRRKQKRWQDGKLKYHTFNKRVMVYDDRGNFIGDTHWRAEDGEELADGEELELDRGCAIVQVCDCVGSREQDLTELVDKRAREVEKRRANAAARSSASQGLRLTDPRTEVAASATPRALHAGLGGAAGATPGRIGRAVVPQHSPYEARKQQGVQAASMRPSGEAPPAKRRKRNDSMSPPSKMGHARNLFGTKLTLSAHPVSTSVFRSQVLKDKSNTNAQGLVHQKSSQDSTQASGTREMRTLGENSSSVNQSPKKANRSDLDRPGKATVRAVPPVSVLDGEEVEQDGWQASRAKQRPAPVSMRPTNAARRPCLAQPDSSRVHKPTPRASPNDRSTENARQILQSVSAKMAKPSIGSSRGRSTDSTGDGPRAALRIKSRQKRGLLVVSERKQAAESGRTERARTRTIEPSSSNHQDAPEIEEPSERSPERELKGSPSKGGMRREEEKEDAGTSTANTPGKVPFSTPERVQRPPSSGGLKNVDVVAANDQEELQNEQGFEAWLAEGDEVALAEQVSTPVKDHHEVISPERLPANEVGEGDGAIQSYRHQPRRNDDSDSSHEPSESESSDGDTGPSKYSRSFRLGKASSPVRMSTLSSHPSPAEPDEEVRSLGGSESDDDDDFEKMPTCSARRQRHASETTRKSKRKAAAKDDAKGRFEERDEVAPTKPKPRIVRLARKSVRSREIIGYPAQDSKNLGRPAFFSGLACNEVVVNPNTDKPDAPADTHVNVTARVNADVTATVNASVKVKVEETSQVEMARQLSEPQRERPSPPPQRQEGGPLPSLARSRSDPSDTVAQPVPPRIANPATRGQKAARKEHAAGQAPRELVHLEPAIPRPASATAAVKAAPSTAQDSTTLSRAPGFVKVGGGPWSKHAVDLLGMERPNRKRSRR